MTDSRLSEKLQPHIDEVAKLYVQEQWKLDSVLDYIQREYDIQTSASNLKRYFKSLNIKKPSIEEELTVLAQNLLWHDARGESATILKWKEVLPEASVRDFLKRNPNVQAEKADLPWHLKVVSVVANAGDTASIDLTQQSSDRGIAQNTIPLLERGTDGHHSHRRRAPNSSRDHTSASMSKDMTENNLETTSNALDQSTAGVCGRAIDLNEINSVKHMCDLFEDLMDKMMDDFKLTRADITDAVRQTGRLQAILRERRRRRRGALVKDTAPLHLAAIGNHVALVQRLLEKGANVNDLNQKKMSPVMDAATKGSLDALSVLLACPGVNVNIANKYGFAALILAISNGHPNCALLLMEKGADVELQSGDERQTPLQNACCVEGMELVIEKILQLQTRTLNAQDGRGETAFHLAIRYGYEQYARLLMKAGADPNLPDQQGHTPLHYACLAAPEQFILDMIEIPGVNLSKLDKYNESVLHTLCQRGCFKAAEAVILSSMVDINACSTRNLTPLSVAAYKGHYRIVKLLLDHGADPSITNSAQQTPLGIAIRKKHIAVAELLIERKSPVSAQNSSTAHIETDPESRSIAETMSDMDTKVKGQNTPSHTIFAQRGSTRNTDLASVPKFVVSGAELEAVVSKLLAQRLDNQHSVGPIGRLDASHWYAEQFKWDPVPDAAFHEPFNLDNLAPFNTQDLFEYSDNMEVEDLSSN